MAGGAGSTAVFRPAVSARKNMQIRFLRIILQIHAYSFLLHKVYAYYMLCCTALSTQGNK